jgi:DNA-directed RNA polymerase subunit omega
MIIPSPDRLRHQVESKYALVIVAAKRARQLKDPAVQTLVRASSKNPLTAALEEIAAGKVIPVSEEEAETLSP